MEPSLFVISSSTAAALFGYIFSNPSSSLAMNVVLRIMVSVESVYLMISSSLYVRPSVISFSVNVNPFVAVPYSFTVLSVKSVSTVFAPVNVLVEKLTFSTAPVLSATNSIYALSFGSLQIRLILLPSEAILKNISSAFTYPSGTSISDKT